jgi:polar amino acid transport system substrate-binding protein
MVGGRALGMMMVGLGLAGGLAPSALAERPRLSMTSPAWAPYTDVEGQKRIAIELVHSALIRIGLEPSTRVFPAGVQVMPKIEMGKFDGSVALWRDEERARYLQFSQPYLENRLVLVARKDVAVDAESFDQLKGKRVALVKGYAYGREVEQAKGPEFVYGPSNDENLKSLLSGAVDYLLADALLVHQMFQNFPDEAERLLAVGRTSLVKRSLHFAIRKDYPSSAEIVRRFDAEIGRMMMDGSFNHVLGVAWVLADVDGDGRAELVAGAKAGTEEPEAGFAVRKEPAEAMATLERQFVIGGKVYDRWEDVPDAYKVPPEPRYEGKQIGVTLLRF